MKLTQLGANDHFEVIEEIEYRRMVIESENMKITFENPDNTDEFGPNASIEMFYKPDGRKITMRGPACNAVISMAGDIGFCVYFQFFDPESDFASYTKRRNPELVDLEGEFPPVNDDEE